MGEFLRERLKTSFLLVFSKDQTAIKPVVRQVGRGRSVGHHLPHCKMLRPFRGAAQSSDRAKRQPTSVE
jgi:hypothetical protein